MNTQRFLSMAVLALAGAAAIPSSSQGAVLTYNNGDLFLAFRGPTNDYLVNIGQASQFTKTASFTLSIGNIAADLSTTGLGGASWASSGSSLLWSVSGAIGNFAAIGSDPLKTIYLSLGDTNTSFFDSSLTILNRQNATAQGGYTTKMGAMGTAFSTNSVSGLPNDSTANSNFGLIQNNGDTNSYRSYMPGGTIPNSGNAPGSAFTTGYDIEGNFANGASGTSLDLIRLAPGAGAGDFVGKFTINGAGAVQYTGASVPEPSTFGVLALGSAVLLGRRRRSSTLPA